MNICYESFSLMCSLGPCCIKINPKLSRTNFSNFNHECRLNLLHDTFNNLKKSHEGRISSTVGHKLTFGPVHVAFLQYLVEIRCI